MVIAGLLLVLVAVAHALRRPEASWRSPRERGVWLAILVVPVPLLFLSVLGPVAAALAAAFYVVRSTAATTSRAS